MKEGIPEKLYVPNARTNLPCFLLREHSHGGDDVSSVRSESYVFHALLEDALKIVSRTVY